MNLILFDPAETSAPLSRRDPRAVHVVDVLRRAPGDTFDTGLIDGPRGRATVIAIRPDVLELLFDWGPPPPPPDPITLIVGLPRPQTARDILRDATTLGVAALHFVRLDKAEPGYAQSTLWSSGEWRRHAIAGAQQAFATRLPLVTHDHTLAEVLRLTPATGSPARFALDNYESSRSLRELHATREQGVILAIGAERGWSTSERDLLRQHSFDLAHLGPRVLRTETAVIAALTLVRAKLGLM